MGRKSLMRKWFGRKARHSLITYSGCKVRYDIPLIELSEIVHIPDDVSENDEYDVFAEFLPKAAAAIAWAIKRKHDNHERRIQRRAERRRKDE